MQADRDKHIAAVLVQAAAGLGAEGRGEVELLLAHALGRPRAWLYAHADEVVEDAALATLDMQVARRAHGEPIAQILGRCGFWTLELRITPEVLIPRADTELLVERALAVLPTDKSVRVADLGAGSGAIALAIAMERPQAQLTAIDASAAAIEVAASNAESLGLSARVRCVRGDWFATLRGERFDLVVSNPPYLAEDDPHLERGDLRFEPRAALASGRDGLDAIRAIVRAAPAHLSDGGWLLLEHGWQQGAAVRALLAESGFEEVATWCDIEQRERVSGGSRRRV
jgi:release factor glutamine methyltransferase